ncbi:MAG: choice-of-anchor J domain-containing protein [Bacteroidales bacterium]
MMRKFTFFISILLFTIVFSFQNVNAKGSISIESDIVYRQNMEGERESNVIYFQNFEEWPLSDWKTYILEKGKGWIQGDISPYEGKSFATRKDEMAKCNDWLVSPKITIAENAYFEFYESNRYMDETTYGDHDIYISVGSGDPADGDFVLLQNMDNYKPVWSKVRIDLKDYANKSIFIAFNYKGNFGSAWEIDAFTVATKIDDLELSELIVSDFVNKDGQILPKVKLNNLGLSKFSDVEIQLNIDSKIYKQQVSIEAESEIEVEFESIKLTQNTKIEASVVASGDQNSINNMLSKEIKILVPQKAYAYCIYSDKLNVPLGPVSFNTEAPQLITSMKNKIPKDYFTNGGTWIDNLWFVSMNLQKDVSVKSTENRLKKTFPQEYALLNPETGEIYHIAPTTYLFEEMAYNMVDGFVYGIAKTRTSQVLCKINYKTGETVEIGQSPLNLIDLVAFAIDKKGVAYVIGTDKILYTVDLNDFSLQRIGTTGVDQVFFIQSMAFDNETDILYWNLTDQKGGAFYAVSTDTGRASKINDLHANAELVAFGFPKSDKKYIAFHLSTQNIANIEGLKIRMNDIELTTDYTGYACFIDLKSQSYPYEIYMNDEKVYSGKLTLDKSKVLNLVLDNKVDIEEISIDDFVLLFPNPGNGVFNIKGIQSYSELTVANINGQVLSSQKINNRSKFDFSYLKAGTYVLTIKGDEGLKKLKLIIR